MFELRIQYDGIQVWSQISNLVYKDSPLPASRCLPTWFSHTSKAGEDVTSPYFSGFSPTPGPFQCQAISQGRQPLLRKHVAHLKPINQVGYEPPKTALPEAAAIKGRKPSLKRPKNMVVACHLRYTFPWTYRAMVQRSQSFILAQRLMFAHRIRARDLGYGGSEVSV